jgi:hypothetical protein
VLQYQSRSSTPLTVPLNGPLQNAASGLPAKSWLATPVASWVTGVALVGAFLSNVALPGALALFAWSAASPWK